MLTCMYQPPAVSLGKTCLLKVNRDTKKVIVRQFTPNKGGHVRVELVQSTYNFISPQRKSVVDIDRRTRQQRPRLLPKAPPPLRPSTESLDDEDEEEDTTDPESDDCSSLSETCGLGVTELEEMAARQARQLETQEQLLAAKAQRLRYLKSGGEAERLLRLREKVATQEERLRKLRALRGKVQSNRNGNAVLSSDLESLRAVFNEKEKELSVAVAKVDELTRQLEDLRRGNKESPNGTLSNHIGSNGQSSASMELEKLRRELMYRQKLRETQACRVADQRAKLTQRQEESNRVDRRIAELQERLHRKRFLNHQLAVTLKHQENVEDFLNSSGLVPIPNKNDPKYQTLPYNAKFTPFGTKQEPQQYQDVQDQAKFDKAIQQMQIIALDHPQHHHHHQQSSPQHPGNNNKLMNNYSMNFQQLHQVLSQNHQNTKSANTSGSNVVIADSLQQQQQSTPTTQQQQPLLNGTGHHPLPTRKSMSSVGGQDLERSPVVTRPSNFVSTEAPSPNNSETNGIFNSQSGTTRTSSVGSNGSISGSSCEEAGGASYQNSDGKHPRPALPPKPSKPTPPTRQASTTGDVFPYLQRSTSDGLGMIPDRTELPIKPKPLFLKKVSGGSGNGNIGTSVLPQPQPPPTTPIGSQDRESPSLLSSAGNGKGNNSTFRMSINRRIEMPPAFLFPESDPPPSDLVPEQYLSSTTSSLSSTSLSSSLLGGNDASKNSENGLRSNDTVDAAPLIHPHQKESTQLGVEEYTLPDLFPTSAPMVLNGEGNYLKQQQQQIPTVLSPNNNTNQYPSTLSLSHGQKTPAGINYSNNNNNNYHQEPQTVISEINPIKLVTTNNIGGSPNGNTNYNPFNNGSSQQDCDQDHHVAVMRVQLERRNPGLSLEDESSNIKPKQSESPDAVIENGIQGKGEPNFCYENGNDSDRLPDTFEGNGNPEGNNRFQHAPISGIIKRMKKGNLKSPNKESPSNGRRVSFDPLALLLDASLEGELELVMKTAKEVANPSAANDEGITALHNAICAGHAEVVRFLVEFGCDVNAQDSDGWTPLHCAASCNNVGMVKFLVEHGACIFATTLSDHETAAKKCEEDEDGFGPCSEYLYSIQEKLGIINNGIVYAVFDYEGQNPDELSFDEGKRLTVLRKGDEVEREWWWSNSSDENETLQGYIPRNLLGLYPRVIPEKRKAES